MNKGTILLVDDDLKTAQMLLILLESDNYLVETACNVDEAIDKLSLSDHYDLILSDMKMPIKTGLDLLHYVKSNFPNIEVILMTAYTSVENAVNAMKMGAYDYFTKPLNDLKRYRMIIEKAIEKTRLNQEHQSLKNQLNQNYQLDNIIGKSVQMQKLFALVKKVSSSDAPILIYGESGTGKELVAKAIHFNSFRKKHPIIAIDCGSLPEHILESELFGHKKGAFTGAINDKKGLIHAADSGTLFLDEISNMTIEMQSKFLRALQEKEIRPIGDITPISVNIRLICASNQDLEELVHLNKFREDLYYRIKVVKIEIPPLRERLDDIPLLIDHFINKFTKSNQKIIHRIQPEALNLLLKHQWPGNIRELENVILYACTLCAAQEITPDDLPEEFLQKDALYEKKDTLFSLAQLNYKEAKNQFELQYINEILKKTKGHITQASSISKIARQNLQDKIKRYGINPKDFKK